MLVRVSFHSPITCVEKLGESEALVSPVLAEPEVLAQWPATDFFAGGLDPLLDDAAFFAHRLQSAGRPVCLHIYDGLPHGYAHPEFISLP